VNVADHGFDFRQNIDFRQIDGQHYTVAANALAGNLAPAAGRGAKIDDLAARLQEVKPIVL
jgi:hypothetical protein